MNGISYRINGKPKRKYRENLIYLSALKFE